jgi:hypothetical protein
MKTTLISTIKSQVLSLWKEGKVAGKEHGDVFCSADN